MTSPRVLYTTLGPLPRERFGMILPHEHVYVDLMLPRLRAEGVAEADIVQFTHDNPFNAYARPLMD